MCVCVRERGCVGVLAGAFGWVGVFGGGGGGTMSVGEGRIGQVNERQRRVNKRYTGLHSLSAAMIHNKREKQ